MNTFIDDIRYNYLPRYGALAQIIAASVALYVVLAVLGLLAFLAGQWAGFDALLNYLRLPSELDVLLYRPWTLVTHAFFHHPTAVFHIVFNMLWLFWFGRIYRDHLADRHVWATFGLGVAAGAAFYIIGYNLLPVFDGQIAYLNGASAGVNAIIVATAALVPNFTVSLMFIGPVRIKWIALILVLLDLALLPEGNPGGRLAHIGGASLGLLYIYNLKKGTDFSAPFARLADRLSARPDRSARSVRVSHRNSSKPGGSPSQQEIDHILDKIASVGYDKLTKEEKQTLLNAGGGGEKHN